MAISVRDIYGKRNASTYTKSGFISGIVTGIMYGITAAVVLVLHKEKILVQLGDFAKSMGSAMPMNALALYNLAVWVSAPATLILYSLLGIIFGLICEKYNFRSPLQILIMSLLVGLALGLVTHLPLSPMFIITSSVSAWGIFGIIFIILTSKRETQS